MEKKILVDIQKDKTLQSSEEPFTGCVNIRTLHPLYVSKVELRIYKQFSIDCKELLCVQGSGEGVAGKGRRSLYNKTLLLYRNPLHFDEFSSGHHAFPFEIQLRKTDSSSVNACLSFESGIYKIQNQYFLEANLYIKNSAGMEKISRTVEIHVIGKFKEAQRSINRIDFSYCLCFFTSNCLLHTRLVKDLYFSGDIACLEVFVKEQAPGLKIKSVIVELCLCLETMLAGQRVVDYKVISKTKGYCSLGRDIFLANIRIPGTLPSSLSEKYLNLASVLYIYISFDMSLPIKIKKVMNIAKNQLEVVDGEILDVLQGITQSKKNFSV